MVKSDNCYDGAMGWCEEARAHTDSLEACPLDYICKCRECGYFTEEAEEDEEEE